MLIVLEHYSQKNGYLRPQNLALITHLPIEMAFTLAECLKNAASIGTSLGFEKEPESQRMNLLYLAIIRSAGKRSSSGLLPKMTRIHSLS